MVNHPYTPRCVQALADGRLEEAATAAMAMMHHCIACGWRCKADRSDPTRQGVCRSGLRACVASFGPHHGEEAVLSGWAGSGTIFFSRCNLRCQFCQNYEISQSGSGEEVSSAGLAETMLSLQARGCHNINLVSPTHLLGPILAALPLAVRGGLRIPLVWNSNGYESLEALALLDGVIDIYMPDMKYGNSQVALRYSKAPHYLQTNQQAVREMHRQVGDLVLDEQGLAVSGLLVRHLVLPGGLAGSVVVMHFLAVEISRDTAVNIMDQYHPMWLARNYPALNRRPRSEEIEAARQAARAAGLWRLEPAF
jgi:putative pyruvate formate lyase activating enzyme